MRKTPLTRKTPLKSGTSRLSRSTPMEKNRTPLKKVNRERLDKRTKAYRAYMQSPAWQGRRFAALVAADWKCARCEWTPFPDIGPVRISTLKQATGLHVHHKTYARFGHELVEDLEVLCERCHMQHHATNGLRPRGLRGGR